MASIQGSSSNTGEALIRDPNLSRPVVKVLVVGSLHMDFIGVVDTHPARNSHVTVRKDDAKNAPGGHGANQAVACARLSRPHPDLPTTLPPGDKGVSKRASTLSAYRELDVEIRVAMMGVVGDQDEHGAVITTELIKNQVNTDEVKFLKGELTGYAHITVDGYGESRVTSFGRANEAFLPPLVTWSLHKPDVLLVQLEIPQETTQHAIALARSHDSIIICNAAPPTSHLHEDIYHVDHFIVNEEQADVLQGILGEHVPASRRFADRWTIYEHYLKACDEFHKRGARCVVVTLSELGVIGSRKDPVSKLTKRYIEDAQKAPGKVIDTTGGSDAFIGGYAVEIAQQAKLGMKEDFCSAIEMGNKAAGLSMTKLGSMDSIPWRNEVLSTLFQSLYGDR